MNWTKLWLDLFGTTEWHGIDLGFWVAMAAVIILVIGMNFLFWKQKPHTKPIPPV